MHKRISPSGTDIFTFLLIGNAPQKKTHISHPRPMYYWDVKPCMVDKYRCFEESSCTSNSRPLIVQVEADRSHIQTVIINQTARRHVPGNSTFVVVIARISNLAKFLAILRRSHLVQTNSCCAVSSKQIQIDSEQTAVAVLGSRVKKKFSTYAKDNCFLT
jgi:hypothetical protein